MLGFLRAIFVYDKRADFLSLFLWSGCAVLAMVAYAKFEGGPLGFFDWLMLAWGIMCVGSWAGLKWHWPGARWLGVATLLSFAGSAWIMDLILREPSFTTFFGFVLVGWAIQLVRMDFLKEDLETQLEGLTMVLGSFLASKVQPPPDLGDLTLTSALEYHLRKHPCEWEVCDQEPCEDARRLERLVKLTRDPESMKGLLEGGWREAGADETQQAPSADENSSSNDALAD